MLLVGYVFVVYDVDGFIQRYLVLKDLLLTWSVECNLYSCEVLKYSGHECIKLITLAINIMIHAEKCTIHLHCICLEI